MPANFIQQRRTQALLYRIRTSTNAVLQYNCYSNSLSVWKWPIEVEGEHLGRVTPSDLRDHCISHRFLGPCCLCPFVTGDEEFREAAIYVVRAGHYNGEYVAGCAQSECGYLVSLERIHSKRGVPLKMYHARDPDETLPPIVLHISEDVSAVETGAAAHPRQLRRSYALLGDIFAIVYAPMLIMIMTTDVNEAQPVQATARRGSRGGTLIKLLQLDSPIRPGLTHKDFWELFVWCTCGLMMTRRASRAHYCAERENDVIDLTSDTETETEPPVVRE